MFNGNGKSSQIIYFHGPLSIAHCCGIYFYVPSIMANVTCIWHAGVAQDGACATFPKAAIPGGQG